MTAMQQQFYYPVVEPADIEWLALYFLTPLIAPTRVATRLPDDTSHSDTVNGFVRVESGGGPKKNLAQFNQTVLLSTYVPQEFEVQGMQIANRVLAFMGAVSGMKIAGIQISDVPNVSTVQRRSDPRVNLLRYLSWVTWTVSGQPVKFPPQPEPVITSIVGDITGKGTLTATT